MQFNVDYRMFVGEIDAQMREDVLRVFEMRDPDIKHQTPEACLDLL